MGTGRRHFLKTSIAAGGAVGSSSPVPSQAQRPLDILIPGGTNLTGPHHVRYALERGHSVSIFTRGRTQPGLFQDAFQHVEHLIGDREAEILAVWKAL